MFLTSCSVLLNVNFDILVAKIQLLFSFNFRHRSFLTTTHVDEVPTKNSRKKVKEIPGGIGLPISTPQETINKQKVEQTLETEEPPKKVDASTSKLKLTELGVPLTNFFDTFSMFFGIHEFKDILKFTVVFFLVL